MNTECECVTWATDKKPSTLNCFQHHHNCPRGAEKKTVFMLKTPEPQNCIIEDVKYVAESISEMLPEMTPGEQIEIEVVEMTVNELLALPDL